MLIVGFVGWMNVTPGHFQFVGCCRRRAIYIRGFSEKPCVELCVGYTGWRDRLMVRLAALDLNK